MTDEALEVIIDGTSSVSKRGTVISRHQEVSYRDAPDQVLDNIRADIAAGVPWRQAAKEHLAESNPWLLKIVTDPKRALWLEHNPPKNGDLVLDVGCGWGQWAIPAARQARVVALEPTASRLNITYEIAKQEGVAQSMHFVGAALEQVQFPGVKFDQIFCIGVLEWVPKFNANPDPKAAQSAFLRRLRESLANCGDCIIGIENRFGLKYLLGNPDDHTSIAGVSVLDATLAASRFKALTKQPLRTLTHTLAEYTEMLTSAGFDHIEFFAAYPDYKVPQNILPLNDGTANQFCLKGRIPTEHDGSNGHPLSCNEELVSHYRSLAQMGIAGNFAPSFFIRARSVNRIN